MFNKGFYLTEIFLFLADINQPDRYNATAWDYARNRQLHYCQLIIMSHQRQRMMSNPTSPLPNGLGLLMHTENGVHEDFSRMVRKFCFFSLSHGSLLLEHLLSVIYAVS